MAKSKLQRDSVVFYRSFYEAVKELEPAQQAEVYNAVFEFGLNGTEPKMTGITKSIFTLMKPQIVANNARYFNGQKGGRPRSSDDKSVQNDDENGGEIDPENELKTKQTETKHEPKQNLDLTESKPKSIQSETKAKPNENVNDNVNENVNENDKVNVKEKDSVKGKTIDATSRAARIVFRKPTVEEIAEYCKSRNNQVDPKRFFDYYESNGWKVGRNSMKDWKASVRTWERNGYDSRAIKGKTADAGDEGWMGMLENL